VVIGYAYVVGDIIHEGHLLHLENCKALCDKLIVGVLTDEAVMEKKPRPAMPFEQRIQIVKGLGCVDAAVTQETYSPYDNIIALGPDILFESTSHGVEYLDELGGWLETDDVRVVAMPYYPKASSTQIKERIKGDDE
jgi:glycerol-3-phosphate cytidylyltransferase